MSDDSASPNVAKGSDIRAEEASPLKNKKTAETSGVTRTQFQDLLNGNQTRNLLLTFLSAFALGLLLVQARQILIPIAIAGFLSAILSPLVFKARRYGMPRPVTAACLMLCLLSLFWGITVAVSEPASRWVKELPYRLDSIRGHVAEWRTSMEDLSGVGESIEEFASTDAGSAKKTIEVEVAEQSWLEQIIVNDLPVIAYGALVVVVLTYFLLISQGKIARGLARLPQSYRMRRKIIGTIREIKTDLSIYLMTITAINCLLGAVVAVALYLLGMPNPIFWGVLAGVFNFAPYVGVIAYVSLLFLGCLATLASLETTLVICGVYLFINAFEGNIVTPAIIGKRLSLTPVSVFISVIVWTWLWGPAGALMAAPILACLKIVAGIINETVTGRKSSVSVRKHA